MKFSLTLFALAFCLHVDSASGRWRRFKEGKFIIGGLFPVTQGPQCNIVRSEGILLAEAFVYILNNTSLSSDTTLGYDIRDSCSSPVFVVKEVQDILAAEKDDKSSENCSLTKTGKNCGVLAIVGPDFSSSAIVTSGILSAYGIPQVGTFSRVFYVKFDIPLLKIIAVFDMFW